MTTKLETQVAKIVAQLNALKRRVKALESQLQKEKPDPLEGGLVNLTFEDEGTP